jgi:hypothetical protein
VIRFGDSVPHRLGELWVNLIRYSHHPIEQEAEIHSGRVTSQGLEDLQHARFLGHRGGAVALLECSVPAYLWQSSARQRRPQAKRVLCELSVSRGGPLHSEGSATRRHNGGGICRAAANAGPALPFYELLFALKTRLRFTIPGPRRLLCNPTRQHIYELQRGESARLR